MKLYPDLTRPRLIYVLADLGIVLWVGLCIYAGVLVYNAVMALAIFGRTAVASGHEVYTAIGRVQQLVATIPLGLGPSLSRSLRPLYRIPTTLIASGQHEIAAVDHMAALLGVIVAVLPLLMGLFVYLTWRVRKTRGLHNLARMLRQPGAASAAATMQVLAARALYTLPYDALLRYSPDPIAEWRASSFERLARAALAADGIAFDRYLRRVDSPALRPDEQDLDAVGGRR